MLYLFLKEIRLLLKYKNIWYIKNIFTIIVGLLVYQDYINDISHINEFQYITLYFIYIYFMSVNFSYFLLKEKENLTFDSLYLSPITIGSWFFIKVLSFFIITELPIIVIFVIIDLLTDISLLSWVTFVLITITIFFCLSLSFFISLIILMIKQNHILALFLTLIINLPFTILLYKLYEVDYGFLNIIYI